MSDVVIRVEGLSKHYRLGTIGRTALHEDLSRWWARVNRKPDPTLRVDQMSRTNASALSDDSEHIWALKDVSFDVKQGEVLGIIGRNGAGKSTLLKILSRVTAPTLGSVKIKGRIASLLEVGTGFHPELTGRDNIFLNGAILGMRRAEITSKLDAIVDFSGCENFIDTPVKRYSSGMYVRLAFAVAAHLEPEILIVDEVLAVGDAAFQQKCMGKMGEVAREGRTVLFVSHNMGSVKTLCTEVICLTSGAVSGRGAADEIVVRYLQDCIPESGWKLLSPPLHRVESPLQIESIEILDSRNQRTSQLLYGDEIHLRLNVRCSQIIEDVHVWIELYSGGQRFTSFHTPLFTMPVALDGMVLSCLIPKGFLMPGNFEIHVGADSGRPQKGIDWVPNAAGFVMTTIPVDNTMPYDRRETGIVKLPAIWEGLPI